MRLIAVPSTVKSSHYAFQALSPSVASDSSSKMYHTDRPVSLMVLCNPFISKTLLKSHKFNKIPRARSVRSSSNWNYDGIFHDGSPFHLEGLSRNSSEAGSEKEDCGHRNKKKVRCAISQNSPFISNKHRSAPDSFSHSRIDFLEPMMLGIKPEFPDWPDQDTVIWANIEQKAKSLDIPLSLRMIKKKLQCKEGLTESKESTYCSVKSAFASMVYIVIELQSHALHMREALCLEDLDVISSKVHKEIHSSFFWLFQQVFSRTPALMLHVMVLLANFSMYSVADNVVISDEHILVNPQDESSLASTLSGNDMGTTVDKKGRIINLPEGGRQRGFYSGNPSEVSLWNSMLDEVKKGEILDEETVKYFVSPVFMELKPDGYEEYLRTDLLYQMNLSQEPNNPLLLCNYAQFLHLVTRDYDRAEECFKRAVQVLPPDAESLSQYANFLWMVKRDVLGAEERYLQALAIEPDNSYHASRYANFLWSTGGEETCFPIDNSATPNR